MERPTPRIQEVLLEEKCLYAVLFFNVPQEDKFLCVCSVTEH